VTSTEPRTDIFEHRADDPVSEQLLLAAARDGSTGAFGILYARHREHAVAVARRALVSSGETSLAEDVAEAAFVDVFTALRNGKGPTDTLRYYLITSVRRHAWRAQRRSRRQHDTVDRWSAEQRVLGADAPAPSEVLGDGGGAGSHLLLTEAFGSLPERWRHVLWLTEVEGRKPGEIAPSLGLSPGSASALAYRARQGLIAAYLAACAPHRRDEACSAIAPRLTSYLSAGRATDAFADVEEHLEGCASCRDVSRGVDLAATTLRSAAPFGLLTAGWWAKDLAAGAGAKAALGAASAGAASGSASGGGGSGGAGGVGLPAGGTIAAAVAAAVVVIGAVVGFARGSDPGSDASAPPGPPAGAISVPSEVEVSAEGQIAPADAAATDLTPTSAPSRAPVPADEPLAPVVRSLPPAPAAPVPERPASPTTVPVTTTTTVPVTTTTTVPVSTTTTVPVTTSVPVTTTTTVPVSTTTTVPVSTTTTVPVSTTTTVPVSTTTTVPVTTTTVPVTTTTTRPVDPEPGPGTVAGRVVALDPADPAGQLGVAGVRISVRQLLGSASSIATSGPDGRWDVASLPAGTYVVLAEVPAAYRPTAGIDPWLGGLTWTAILGIVEVDDRPLDLVDLVLVRR
jgi:RNA polymerase sigma factor (sigma-70 family)